MSPLNIYFFDFYPRPPRGGRPKAMIATIMINEFLSTPSARRATWGFEASRVQIIDFYPRPPRGGRRKGFRRIFPNVEISIHALREEGDEAILHADDGVDISIHALREEGDPFCPVRNTGTFSFLSTPSARRATFHKRDHSGFEAFLSTPSARRATKSPLPCHGRRKISIHALREEGDLRAAASALEILLFLSTPSARRATRQRRHGLHLPDISIHALREEGDFREIGGKGSLTHFYPRPPRGGRPFGCGWCIM